MKKHLDDKIDDLLRNTLGNLQAETSQEDWKAISKGLDKKQGKPSGLLKGISLVVLACLLTISGIYIGYHYINPSSAKLTFNGSTAIENRKAEVNSTVETNKLNPNATKNVEAAEQKAATSSTKVQGTNNDVLEANNNLLKHNKSTNTGAEANNALKSASKSTHKSTAIGDADNPSTSNNFASTSETNNFYKDLQGHNNSESESSENSNTQNENGSSTNGNVANKGKPEMANIFGEIGDINNDDMAQDKKLAQSKALQHNYLPRNIPKSYNRLYIEIGISPNYNSVTQQTKPGSADQINEDYTADNKSQTKTGVGFLGGIKLDYRVWNNFSIHSGIQYSSISTNVDYQYTINKIPVIDSASRRILGYITSQNPQQISYKGVNTYTYISIPVEISYALSLTDRLALRLNAGADMMMNTGASGAQIRPDNLQLTDLATATSLQKTNYGYQVAVGIDYAIMPRLKLEILPIYHKTINPLLDNSALINNVASSFGVQFGLKFGIL